MLASTLSVLLALSSQAVVAVYAASLADARGQFQHKLRQQHYDQRERQHDVIEYDELANLLKEVLKMDEEETDDSEEDLIEMAAKQSLPRRNRSLDNGVLEQQTCKHENLISCEDYGGSGEMECRVTATGMNCCRCKGRLIRRQRRVVPIRIRK